jgi:hypothetical protein
LWGITDWNNLNVWNLITVCGYAQLVKKEYICMYRIPKTNCLLLILIQYHFWTLQPSLLAINEISRNYNDRWHGKLMDNFDDTHWLLSNDTGRVFPKCMVGYKVLSCSKNKYPCNLNATDSISWRHSPPEMFTRRKI